METRERSAGRNEIRYPNGSEVLRDETHERTARCESGTFRLKNALKDQTERDIELSHGPLALLAHEVRGRLQTLSMLTCSLRRSVDEHLYESNRDLLVARLDRQARCLEQLEHIIDTVLCAYRVETGELEPLRRPEDLCEIVRDVIRAESDALANARCDCLLDAPEHVFGAWDRAQIEIAVANLLSNASKYGSGRPIEVGVSVTHDTAFVRIRDHGVGIAPEDLPRLFQRFGRLESDGAPSGIGLGLWFARAIALAHGGNLSAESEHQEGADFTLELPRS